MSFYDILIDQQRKFRVVTGGEKKKQKTELIVKFVRGKLQFDTAIFNL
jgi:hypothetical protein